MKTQEQKDAAILALTENKKIAPRVSFFGTDNHGKIDAMIHVIKSGISEDAIYNEYEDSMDDEDNDLLQGALDARFWLDGDDDNIDEYLFTS